MPFLPECYPLLFFYVHCTLEIHSAGDKLHSILDDLEQVFPGSSRQDLESADDEDEGGCSIIKGLRALVYYHVRGMLFLVAHPIFFFGLRLTFYTQRDSDFDESSSVFASLQKSDPYRIEDVDILSNILYVSEKRAELAKLAQDYVQIERMRPEVCCLVGMFTLSIWITVFGST